MSMQDLMIILVAVPAIVITSLIGWTILDEWNNNAVTSTDGSESSTKFVGEGKTAIEIFDGMLIFTIVSVILGSAILATQIKTHPVFLIPGFLVLAVIIFGGAQIATVTFDVYQASGFSTAANEFPGFLIVIENLPLILLVGGGIIAYVLWGKPFSNSGETTI